jgi:FtsP/CotA-like multicopper oxidase with cupredoxin domain
MDGVNGVTQCPIPCNSTFTYNFTATQYGHTWYHSHYSLSYPDGLSGPLVIHGPTSDEWDIDLGPIVISDWIHDTAFVAFHDEEHNRPPKVNSTVVNGVGFWIEEPADPNSPVTGDFYRTSFTPGAKHLLRLVNGAIASGFVFSIDNHTMTVVANDLVAITPYETDSLFLAIGTISSGNSADGSNTK